MTSRVSHPPGAAAIKRLAAWSPLDADALVALAAAVRRSVGARQELRSDEQEGTVTLLMLNGWAAHVRVLEDGRRQILAFLLPGDLIVLSDPRVAALSTVIAITGVDACVAPDAGVSPSLARAYDHGRALAETCLHAQITRLGRLTAHERIIDLLLELLERLELAGLAENGRYVMPLTQELVADTLGLTSVHVNRTLQVLRREGALVWKGRELVIPDAAALRRTIGRAPVGTVTG